MEGAIGAAAAALSRAAGRAVRLHDAVALSDETRRNLILRAQAGGIGPVIVKARRAAYDPGAADCFEQTGPAREWTALRLLGAPGRAGHAPRLLAADLSTGVLVLEDLGAGVPSLVAALLHGSAEDAERGLTAYALALAGLHGATAGCAEEHAALLRSGFPQARSPAAGQWVAQACAAAAPLGGTVPEAELEQVAERLRAPGPWAALVHRDPCPDNILLPPGGPARPIDFEFSAPGHVLRDAVYWHVGFPTCWCAGRVPAAVAGRIDRAYRGALAVRVPAAADEGAFRRERAMLCAAWLFDCLEWQLAPALAEGGDWGIATRRGRLLHYTAQTAALLDEAGLLPGLRDLAARWSATLQDRWPGERPLPPYPAFVRS